MSTEYSLQQDKNGAISFWSSDPEWTKRVLEYINAFIDAEKYRALMDMPIKTVFREPRKRY